MRFYEIADGEETPLRQGRPISRGSGKDRVIYSWQVITNWTDEQRTAAGVFEYPKEVAPEYTNKQVFDAEQTGVFNQAVVKLFASMRNETPEVTLSVMRDLV